MRVHEGRPLPFRPLSFLLSPRTASVHGEEKERMKDERRRRKWWWRGRRGVMTWKESRKRKEVIRGGMAGGKFVRSVSVCKSLLPMY